MHQNAILVPILGLMLLTFIVWAYMYMLRLGYIARQGVNPQDLATPEKGWTVLPESVNLPAHNLRNLTELPVIFYALCLYLFVTASADYIYLAAAWTFVGLRVAHSLIHCTVNIVRLRFASYFLGALVLWAMVARAIAGS